MTIKKEHQDDLLHSGLSEASIIAMNIKSCDGGYISRKIHHNEGSFDPSVNGYEIPYFSLSGEYIFSRFKMFWDSSDDTLPKYLSPEGSIWDLYIPPFARDLITSSQYLIVTEGEKKAAKACQEGIPCVAIPGVYMWIDKAARECEKSKEYSLSYKTKILDSFQNFKDKKIIILFDSDAKRNKNVNHARNLLKDALLYQNNTWVKILDIPEYDATQKMGLDDWLCDPIGYDKIGDLIHHHLQQRSDTISPLLRFPYKESATGTLLHYIVPNTAIGDKFGIHKIIKEQETVAKDGTVIIEDKQIASTRIWLNRLVRSIDGDNKTLYELAYIPLDKREPQFISGGSELIRFSNKNGDDVFSDYGARILSKDKPLIEEFINDCQTYGIRADAIKVVDGTKRRGWLEYFDGRPPVYIMPNKLVTDQTVYAFDSPKIPLLPVETGNDSAMRDALIQKGDINVWKEMIYQHVFTSPLPAILISASLAGLLRKWCPDSENFIVHLYGESSHGKTTALRLAASAWGLPEKMIDNWRSTDNGLERRCVSRNDMVMMLDEAGMAQSEDIIKNSVYMIGNGGEKLRANKDASERITRRFQLVALSTGEKQLIRDAKFAGQEVRTIELNANAIGGTLWHNIRNGQDAEKLNFILSNHYGWGVEKMLRFILKHIEKDVQYFHKLHLTQTQQLREFLPVGTPAHISRRVKHFGLIVTTWTIFLQAVMELDTQSVQEYTTWMINNIGNNLLQLDTDQFKMGENEGILSHLITAVTKNQHKFYSKDNETIKGEVYGVIEDSKICIIPSGLSEIAKPFDNARMVYIADSIGALIYNKDKKKQDKKMTRRIGTMRADCYIFDLEKIEQHLKK